MTDFHSGCSWDEASFPSFDYSVEPVVNVKLHPFGAKGDGTTDDYDAIQRAINAAEVVLIPKGHYRLSRSLVLRASTKLIGVARTLSILMAMSTGLSNESPQPLVHVPDSTNQTVIAFLTGKILLTVGIHSHCVHQNSRPP